MSASKADTDHLSLLYPTRTGDYAGFLASQGQFTAQRD
jgi:hypothetical protein